MERIIQGRLEAQTKGGGKIVVKIESGQILLHEEGKGKRKPEVRAKVPEGAIASLVPLMQEAFSLYDEGQETGYWEWLAERAPLSPRQACQRLRRAGISHVQAAEMVIAAEPRVSQAIAFGRLGEENAESFVSTLATAIRKEYNCR